MSNGDELEQTMQALEMAKMRLESMAKDAEILQASLSEHARAVETLRALSKTKEGNDILVPVGAGAFIPAKASGATKAMIGIGAGLTVEKSIDDAIASLEKDAAEIELQERKMIQEMKNLEKQAAMLQQRFRQLQQAAMAPEPPSAGKQAAGGHVHDASCDHDHDHEHEEDEEKEKDEKDQRSRGKPRSSKKGKKGEDE